MNDQSICHFVPDSNENEKIHIVNFVYETAQRSFAGLKKTSVYKLYYIKSGKGVLHLADKRYSLTKGDIFFTFPSTPFAIESVCDFKYLYVSYLGTRASKIHEGLGINHNNCFFPQYGEAEDYWTNSINVPREASALRAESLLLYTFSLLSERLISHDSKRTNEDAVLLIKKLIDDNISDCELSLNKISKSLSYNAKYVSSLFKKRMEIGISEYITTVRIQHACTLMEQGFTSIKDIASMCGFRDALYFSKIFKKEMGLSPREHIVALSKQ